ncbi:MAG: hypothetical protein HQL01_14985 [Nitrospirae bacterium]|nr:hypothetical protein [Nitrospirota bacterium]
MASKAKKTTRAKVSSYWKGHIEAWQGSGKTQAEYCRHALKLKAFAYRKRQFGKSPAKAVFHSVRIIEEKAKISTCLNLKMKIGTRYCIEIRDGFNPATLHQLLETLER